VVVIRIFSSIEEAHKKIPKGSIRLLIIDGRKIGLAHNTEGFYAFDNACPHQHEPLNKGIITQYNEVVCALHHYRFSLKTGIETKGRCESMNVYSVKIEDDGVFIDI
jgi:nitrite reductase/ring-hydroxylating ferredoxin subunit